MKKEYTIGEIYRLQLLKNHKGDPYSDKASISRLVNSMNYKEKKTVWGISKVVSQSEIDQHNKKYT